MEASPLEKAVNMIDAHFYSYVLNILVWFTNLKPVFKSRLGSFSHSIMPLLATILHTSK